MKKIITFVIVVLIAGFFGWNYSVKPTNINLATVSQASDNSDNFYNLNNRSDVEIEYEILDFDFTFTGYGPAGRFHNGIINSRISDDNQIVFDMTTVQTDEGQNERLDDHLCQDDFFSCDQNPESFFTLSNIEFINQTSSRVNGTFRLKGVTKNISFVAESNNALSDTNNSATYNGSFLLDTTEFGFKVPIVEPEVLIEFDFTVRQNITEIEPEEIESSEEVENSDETDDENADQEIDWAEESELEL